MAEDEIIRIRKEMQAQYSAAIQALKGYAVTSQHDFIQARIEQIGGCHEKLQTLVGEQEAIKIVADLFEGL